MSDRGMLTALAEELALALQPLTAAFSSQEATRDFLEDLGWDFEVAPAALESLRTPAEQIFGLASDVASVSASDVTRLLDGIRGVFRSIADLGSAGGLASDFKNEFPRQLVDYLLVEYLLQNQPRWGYALMALGIIRLEDVPASGDRPAYLRRIFAFDDFGVFFNEPLVFFNNTYNWGQPDFDGERLALNVAGLFDAWGVEGYYEILDSNTLDELNSGALQPEEAFETSLRLPLIEHNTDPAELSVGFGLFLLPETDAAMPGFALLPFVTGEVEEEIALSDQFSLAFKSSLDLTGGLGILVRPGSGVELLLGFATGTPSTVSGEFALSLRLTDSGAPVVLIGAPDASRFEIAGASISGGTRFESNGKSEVFTELALEGGKIAIKPGPEESDGFLARLLPPDGLQIEADVLVGSSTTRGLYFAGSGGLEISLPVHIELGPIEIQSALLAVKFGDGGIPVELAATIKADLAVLKAVVENVGVRALFTLPPDRDGNLGPVNLALAFRPPNGIGLAVDAGVVKGGGYLYFDVDNEEYAGALELVFSDFLTLKAIGLITTRMPDGSKGFSLLIIITAEFGTGYQLGYGFKLLGVGGLLGLNRTMKLQPLVEGVRTGAVQSVVFPQDIIENAPRIISDLRTFFPPAEGIFLIGPMAKLGWGTPTLISLSLGIIIEIPGNIAILGVLKAALPTEDEPLLVLQVNFLGAIEFDKERAYFFAAMFESRVLFMTIEGEMGVLVAWGADANFVVSVGGFHPQFNPPALPFPSPKRISLSILNESYGRIRAMGYFAITSNTVQFGSRTELYFGLSEFKVEGHLGFDALIQFNPFFFIIEISAGVSLKVFGIGLFSISLRFSLEGPTPWRAKGYGKIKLLFFSFKANFDFTWGQPEDTTLPPIEVMPVLVAELEKFENWMANVPAANSIAVSLRTLPADVETLVLHPVGTLVVSQRAVPLDLTLDKIGSQKPSDARKFSLTSTGGFQEIADVNESFALAQYQDLTDADKLSRPAFQPKHGGLEMSASEEAFQSGKASKRVVRYETIIIDTSFRRHVVRFYAFAARLFSLFLGGNSVSRTVVSNKFKTQLQPFAEGIEVRSDAYAVAFNRDNTIYSDQAVFSSEAMAREFLSQEIARDASLAETLHVIPQFELGEAA